MKVAYKQFLLHLLLSISKKLKKTSSFEDIT